VNRFVADFIGETNFLPPAPRAASCASPGRGELLGEGPGRRAPSRLSHRPEQLRLTSAAEPGPIAAQVEGRDLPGTDSHLPPAPQRRHPCGRPRPIRTLRATGALAPGNRAWGLRPAPGAVQSWPTDGRGRNPSADPPPRPGGWLLSAPRLRLPLVAPRPLLVWPSYSVLSQGDVRQRPTFPSPRGLVPRSSPARHLRRHVRADDAICDLLALALAVLVDDPLTFAWACPPPGSSPRAARRSRSVAFPDHHPVLDQPPDPHLRIMEIIRNEGLLNTRWSAGRVDGAAPDPPDDTAT
jgi:hypothetical protein